MRRFVLSIFAAPLLLVACGTAPSDPLRDAAERTAEAGSSRVSWVLEYEGERMTVDGALDYDRGTGYATVRSSPGEEMPEMELRFAEDGKAYVRLSSNAFLEDLEPNAARELRDKWFPLGDSADWDLVTAAVPLPGAGRPDNVVELLRFADAVTVVGNEQVRGEPTTHYRATLDVTRLVDAAKPSDESWIEELRQVEKLPTEIWVDDDGRARRVVLSFPPIDDGPACTITIELFDFGLAVDAPRPPGDQIADDESGIGFWIDTDRADAGDTDAPPEDSEPLPADDEAQPDD